MSIFDVLTNGSLSSALDVLASQAKSAAKGIQNQTPGGMGGLLGAGALGALLGNVMSSDVVRNVALAGAGAVAWNFYRKWANSQKGAQEEALPQGAPAARAVSSGFGGEVDPTSILIMRAMNYAARADGTIDATEQQRIDAVVDGMLPGENTAVIMKEIQSEPIDPNKIAAQVGSKEQAEDVYRLSCAIIDIDQFMELNYTAALAKALGISDERKREIEQEAAQAREQLKAALPA